MIRGPGKRWRQLRLDDGEGEKNKCGRCLRGNTLRIGGDLR